MLVSNESLFLLQVLELESIKTHHWQILWCSALTAQNLLEGVNWLIDDIAARIFTLD
jgi:ADP-ribosylation factor-like protein 2